MIISKIIRNFRRNGCSKYARHAQAGCLGCPTYPRLLVKAPRQDLPVRQAAKQAESTLCRGYNLLLLFVCAICHRHRRRLCHHHHHRAISARIWHLFRAVEAVLRRGVLCCAVWCRAEATHENKHKGATMTRVDFSQLSPSGACSPQSLAPSHSLSHSHRQWRSLSLSLSLSLRASLSCCN